MVLGYRDQKRPETPFFVGLVQTLILIVLIIHGTLLHDSIFNGDTFVFGFAQDLSLMAWVGLSFYWIQSFFLPISSLRLMAISMAMFCAVLPDLFPGSVISQRAVADPWFKAHFIVATFAVGFFSLAAMLAVLMRFQDRALRKGMANGMAGAPTWVESLPPLLTMESFLFRLLYVGYGLLTLQERRLAMLAFLAGLATLCLWSVVIAWQHGVGETQALYDATHGVGDHADPRRGAARHRPPDTTSRQQRRHGTSPRPFRSSPTAMTV